MTWYVGTIQKYSMKTGLYHVAYDAKPKINSKDVVTLMSSSATSLKKEKNDNTKRVLLEIPSPESVIGLTMVAEEEEEQVEEQEVEEQEVEQEHETDLSKQKMEAMMMMEEEETTEEEEWVDLDHVNKEEDVVCWNFERPKVPDVTPSSSSSTSSTSTSSSSISVNPCWNDQSSSVDPGDATALAQAPVGVLRQMCMTRNIPIASGAHSNTCIKRLVEWKNKNKNEFSAKSNFGFGLTLFANSVLVPECWKSAYVLNT